MADIFVSYARADRARVAPLVAALEGQGWSVWWDPAITPGQEFDRLISAELEAAKAVIVVWTPASVDSRWVRGEAREAADRAMLVPVRFGDARLPLDVRSLHTTDLDDWREDTLSPAFQELVRAVRALLNEPSKATEAKGASAPKPETPQVRMTSVLSLDVAGYSKRTEADQNESAREIVALRNRLNGIAARHGGRIFNTAGDSIMVEFPAAKEAVAAIFELLDDRPLSEPETRVGAHLGDVTVAANGDLLGHGVNVAARLMAQAQPGHALISAALKDAFGHIDRPLRPLGEVALAKMDTRVQAFEITPKSSSSYVHARPAKLKLWQVAAIAAGAFIVIGLGIVLTLNPFANLSKTVGAAPAAAGQSVASAPPLKLTSLAPAKPRIAILPFENLSPDPNNAFFTDGLHEEILTALANSAPGLDVVSRTTMMLYRDHPASIEQLAKDLGCTHVLEGSVRREGNKVRLTLQLIDAHDDSHVWAQDYDRTLTSALSLESEVAKAVAYQLAVQLTPSAKAANAPTQDPLAYDFYLKARLIRPSSGMAPDPDWLKGADLLTLAINRDPSFTLAYVERFGIYLFLYLQHDTTGRFRTLAKSDLDAAQRLAPGSPAVLGMEAEWAFAEQDLKRSLDFFSQAKAAGLADPNILTWESALHSLAGNYDESLSTLARLAAIDPGNAYVLLITGLSEAVGGRTAQALKIFDVLAARAPGDTLLRIQRPFLEFMMTGAEAPFAVVDKGTRLLNFPEPDHPAALWYAGHYKETRDQIDRLSYKDMSTGIYSYSPVFGVPKSPVVWVRGQIDLQLGDRKEADKDAKAVLSWVASQSETKWNRWFLRYLTAFAHLLQGDKASAIRFAHEALKLSPDGGTGVWPVAPYLAATVLAMAGEQDEAAKLLEKVAFGSPCILPVEIVRNPELTVSLADNPRYQMLKAKLEAQMVENRKLFASPQ